MVHHVSGRSVQDRARARRESEEKGGAAARAGKEEGEVERDRTHAGRCAGGEVRRIA